MINDLQKIIGRIKAGSLDEIEIQAIAAAIQTGQLVLVPGSGAIGVDGNVENSLIVSGNSNFINNTIILSEEVAAKIQALLDQRSQTSELPLDELVQKVRSRASAKVLNLFSKIQLLNKRQIDVDRLYVDVYVLEMQKFQDTIPALLEGRDGQREFDRLGLGKQGERLQGLAIATNQDYPRLMVLGKPGSGKSTFLRHLAVGCARGEFLSDSIPVLLELRDVDSVAFSLFQCLHQEFELEQEAQTEQILKRGQVLILLDGLDEVPNPLQPMVQSELRKFVKRYDKNRFILTCRTQTTEYIPEQFQAIEVADFELEQVECFALNWFRATAETPEQGASLKDHFMEKLRESPPTAELVVTPVLLSLACWVFDDLKCLPQKRSDLYQDGLDLLLQQWDEGRGISRDSGCDRYRQLTTEKRKRLLSYLAIRKFEQADNFVLFEEAEICGYIAEHLQISPEESRSVLQAIAQQHGLLIERASRIWSFSHLTFQEYLVAKWFCTQQSWEALAEKINLSYWHEVFVLAAELCLSINELLRLMKKHTDKILESDRELQLFISRVYEKSESVKAPYYSAKIRALYFNINRNNIFDLEISHESEGLINENFDLNFNSILNKNYAPECVFDFELSLLLYEAYWLNAINRDRDYSFGSRSIARRLNEISKWKSIDRKLVNKIQELQKSLPNSSLENWEVFKIWWREQGYSWAEQLRELLVKHRGIRYDLEFLRDEQWNLLEQYYVANQLLVSCLNIGCEVSNEIKQEIEETLLLPIAESEKRKNQILD